MPQILVRNVSQEAVDLLKRRAKQRGRSLQAELLEVIEKEARSQPTSDFWTAAAAAREEMRGRWRGNSADLIREDRDSR